MANDGLLGGAGRFSDLKRRLLFLLGALIVFRIGAHIPVPGIDPERVNPMGNAIALGHPLGATGAILTLTCAYALRRTKKRYGIVTMCIGGGQGIALVLESMG